jgi:hypothetical protein
MGVEAMQNGQTIDAIRALRPRGDATSEAVTWWRANLASLLSRRARRKPASIFQKCLAIHIHYAGARTALS